MATDKPVLTRAHLAAIEAVGDLTTNENSARRSDHFVIVSVDEKVVAKSEKKPGMPSPRWEWQEHDIFWLSPSSTIKIAIYRKSRNKITNHIIGQRTRKAVELLENDSTTIDLKDKTGATITPKIKIKLSLVSEPGETFMTSVEADILRLDGVVASIPLSTLGKALQLTKKIMDALSNAHPILKASWTILSAVYEAVQQAQLLNDDVRYLAESLQEMLGIAEAHPTLLVIEGTINVIEEVGRTSLKIASVIHEYTRLPFIRRTLTSQLSDDIKPRVAECQKCCDDLKQKFNTRLNMETNHHAARIEAGVKEIKGDNANIQRALKIIKDDQLAEKVLKWLSAPDSSKNYNEAREKHQKDTCSWFLDGTWFRDLQEKADILWIKEIAGCGKTILCSSIIASIANLHCGDEKIGYAYFFFDGRDSQKDLQLHDKFIRSLIMQFSLRCGGGIPAALADLYGHGQEQPSTWALQEILQHILDRFHSAFIIIDSLDECTERYKVLKWIKKVNSQNLGNLHMVVASRPEKDISDFFGGLANVCSVDITQEAGNDDIAAYLEQHISEENWDEGTRERIKLALMNGAQGMFRWVALQLLLS